MRRRFVPLCGIGIVAALILVGGAATPLSAQATPPPLPDAIEVPDLSFTPTADIVRDYDKYFYYHRTDTDFATALADIRECDAYARGIGFRVGASAFAGPVTAAMFDAIFASGERRRIRRVNMRMCMRFKEYRIYGVPKSLWEQFNFEEGNSRVPEARRQHLLQIQARVASGPVPLVGEVAQ
jgi:hypothetical protein